MRESGDFILKSPMESRLNTQEKKVVWILGAGFSIPLGGPPLKDLLAPRNRAVVREQAGILVEGITPEETNRREEIIRDMSIVREIFADGSKGGLWSHAEDFLDVLETANHAENAGFRSAGQVQIQKMLENENQMRRIGIKELTKAARHAIAFDCSVFLRAADVNSEKWEPYRDWARTLDGNDSVVTFNYDCIPDLLAEQHPSNLCVAPPDTEPFKATLVSAKNANQACVLKVHGSLDWGRDDKRVFKAKKKDGSPNRDASLLWNSNDEFAIGVPGPSKRDLIAQALQHIWDEAMARIGSADIVVLLGYRFPPTDSMARLGVLRAIRDNKAEMLRVVTVLGPNNPDEPRLKHLLESALDSSQTNRFAMPQPLFCRPCNSYLAGQRRNCGWRRARIARRDDPKGRRGQSQITALGISVQRALAVVTTADDLFLAQLASPADHGQTAHEGPPGRRDRHVPIRRLRPRSASCLGLAPAARSDQPSRS